MKLNISQIKLNNHNPRDITFEQKEKLKQSIQEFPEMLETRPLIIDENNVVLGGNMRLRVLQELGYEEVPVKQVKGWTEKQKKEFIVKDNVSHGHWDWEMLANEWEGYELDAWGVEGVPVFNPELNPTFDTTSITNEEIEARAKQLAAKIVAKQKQEGIEAICPECGHEFRIR
jgi:hypothetical protein